jgi:hypothetical protein
MSRTLLKSKIIFDRKFWSCKETCCRLLWIAISISRARIFSSYSLYSSHSWRISLICSAELKRVYRRQKIWLKTFWIKWKKRWNSALLRKLRFLASNETLLIRKRLIKIVSSLKQLTSKESCLIKIWEEIVSSSRVNHSVRWSESKDAFNIKKISKRE